MTILNYQMMTATGCLSCLPNIFPFNAIEDEFEFQCCIFNYINSNKLIANLIKNLQQLELVNKLKICNDNIDPAKYF